MWPCNGLLYNMRIMLSTSKHWQFFLLQIHSNPLKQEKRKYGKNKKKKKPAQETTYKDTLNSIFDNRNRKKCWIADKVTWIT